MDLKRTLILYLHVCAGLIARRLAPCKRPAASESRVGKRPAASPRLAGSETARPVLPDPVKLAQTAVRQGTFSQGPRNPFLPRVLASDAEKSEDDLTRKQSLSSAAFAPARGPFKIGNFAWQEGDGALCLAEQDELEPDEEHDTGEDADVPLVRTCVQCGFSSRFLLPCPSCCEFSCVRCFHRCGI